MKRLFFLPVIICLACCSKSKQTAVKKITVIKTTTADTVNDNKKYVALFYFTGFGDSFYSPANTAPNGDAWIVSAQTPAFGPNGTCNFWGKPSWAASHTDGTIINNYRYYFNGDPAQPNDSLLYYHANLITQAGVDFVVLDFTNGAADFTNGPSYISATTALCNSWSKRIQQGLPTPQIVFFVRNQAALTVVENTFFNKYPATLFFNYLGKKLLLVARPDDTLGEGDAGQPAVPTSGDYANYTARHCWGLENDGICWQFKVNDDTPPNAFVYNGKPEEMCAPAATQASYMTQDGVNPTAGAQGRQGGAYFKKYMAVAISAGVKFVFIHSWNEWNALNVGTQQVPVFTDQWNEEYSSDIEPMAGGHTDQYYQLMKAEITAFKK
jgi:hypothetical protein